MRRFVGLSCFGLLLLAALACGWPGQPSEPPNILVYMVDALRADVLEPYGAPPGRTPRLAEFAEEAILFERAYAHSSWTRSSIASVLSGLPPDLHGVESREDAVPKAIHLLAEHLRDAGYSTGAVVTNPNVGRHFGFAQGFDHFVELFPRNKKMLVDKSRGDSTEVNRHALEWMDQAERPFFLFLLTSDPHWPYAPPVDYRRFESETAPGKGKRNTKEWRRYLGEVAYNDHSFGVLVDGLRERSLLDETLVVFTSDHGEGFGEHKSTGHGRHLFDEVVRVPLLVRRPHEPGPARRIGSVVALRALFSSLLEAAGVPLPEAAGRALPTEAGASDAAVYGRLELDGYQGEMLIEAPWKLIVPQSDQPKMSGGLFHIDRDPGELLDQKHDTARRESMRTRLAERASRHASLRVAGEESAVERELPDEVRDALEALGYLDAEGTPRAGAPDAP